MKKQLIFTILAICLTGTAKSQVVEFEDTSFQRAILNHDPIIDLNGDNFIQKSEADSVTVLKLYLKGVNSIQDVHSFPNVKEISAASNNLTVVFIDSLEYLEVLLLAGNKIETLSVTNAPNLIDLYAPSNQITSLFIENCPTVDHLVLSQNRINEIDLSGFPNLTYLSIDANEMGNLDLKSNPKIKQIYCRDLNLTEIDIRNNPLIDFDRSGFDSDTKLIMTSNQESRKKSSKGPPPPVMRN